MVGMKIFGLVALLLMVTSTAEAITIATVPVGNPGNANDPSTGSLFGGVAYNYNIGEYDVTVGQYTAFLNAVAATDTYGLYNSGMATDGNVAGIQQNGPSGGYTYNVIGSANHPITYVNWFDAASALSQLDFRVEGFEFTAGVADFHLPVDAALGGIDVGRPSGQF